MEALLVATLRFSRFSSCFIRIPKEWARQATNFNDDVVIYELSSAQTACKAFVSWNHETTHDDCIEISTQFAELCGFCDGEEVTAERRGNVHCAEQVAVQTSSLNDYEKLVECSDFLESHLMNQIRVVWPGMKFLMWTTPSSPILVDVVSVVPNCKPVLLIRNTAVSVVPTTQSQAVVPSHPSPLRALNEGNSLRSIASVVGAFPSWVWSSVLSNRAAMHSLPHSRRSHPSLPPEQCAEFSLTWPGDICFTARVIPRKFFTIEPLPVHNVEKLLREHPTTIFVSRSQLRPCDLASDGQSAVTFVASMSKITSPQEKLAKAALDSKGESSASQKQAAQIALPDCETCFVRVFAAPTAWTDFHFLHGSDLALVPDALRRQLGLNYASKVKIKSLSASEQPVALSSITLHPIGNTTFTKRNIASAFRSWCRDVSASGYPLVLSSGGLLRLKWGDRGGEQTDFLIKLSHQRGDTEDVANDPQNGESEMKYCFLSDSVSVNVSLGKAVKAQRSKKCALELPMSNISLLNPDLHAPRLEELGGVKELCENGLAWLKLLTTAQPTAVQLCGQQQLVGDVLLITGQRGSGKSTLAKSLALRLLQSPPFAHVDVIECSSLRGKRPEKIAKMWENIVSECCFREPAVLVFDDLDTLAGAVAGPEQEKSPGALYFNKVADAFFNTLVTLRDSCTRVAVIVTGRSREAFNTRLTASHGQHIFYTMLAIPPPNKAEREEVLRCLVKMRPHLSKSQFDYSKVAHQTEGCYAKDLVAILDRATHAFYTDTANGTMSTMVVHGLEQEIVLLDDHFERALEEYCPASLRGLNLRAEHTLHWRDAGGLDDVKQTLQEVFLWPTKYPELFANCPIRPLSGLLLYGAPGTGKTLLAGIVASECAVNFISIKGPELLSKYIGASEQAVRNVFQRAQSAKPCIIFFDEFDSIAPRRGHDSTGVTDRVVNQLLTLLDGVETSTGVYVLAATSRPDLIDPALLRPGRLDKCLHCPLPNTAERASILVALSRKLLLADDVDLDSVAACTEHFSGADLQALLYTAQLEVVHEVFPQDELQGDSPGRRFDCSWSSDESPGLGESEFFYAPSVSQGPTEPVPDKARQLQQEVNALSENLLGQGPRRQQHRRSRRDSTALALSIHQRHLEQALASTSASISAVERRKFDTIYSLFRSGSSLAELRMAAGQRVTLA